MQRWRMIWTMLAFMVAVIVTAALGSMVQTQFNMAALLGMGVTVPPTVWLQTMLQDLLGFAPLYALPVGLMLLFAFTAAGLLRRLTGCGPWVYPLAAGVGMAVALVLMVTVLPMNPLAVARYLSGCLALVITAVIGGQLYVLLRHRHAR